MELVGSDIDDLMGEFMREQDAAILKDILNGDKDRIGMLRQELVSNPSMAAQYRRGVQLCMRYAYWRSTKVPENDVFMDASGCLWTTTEQNHGEHPADMLVMRTTQDIPFEDVHNASDNGRWLRAMGFLDALDHLSA
jgi:hypothetical protein